MKTPKLPTVPNLLAACAAAMLSVATSANPFAQGAVPVTAPNPGTPWPATDALSRSMPDAAEVPAPRPDRFVGIFYFLTHGRNTSTLPNDISRILPQDPDLLKKPDSPLWGLGGPYYWGQPLYGYYDSRDPWVLRRHATLLADAGVDTVSNILGGRGSLRLGRRGRPGLLGCGGGYPHSRDKAQHYNCQKAILTSLHGAALFHRCMTARSPG